MSRALPCARQLFEEASGLYSAAGQAWDNNVKLTRLQQATDKWSGALEASDTDYDRSRACKNLGTAASWMAQYCPPRRRLAHTCDSIRHMVAATEYGLRCRTQEWLQECSGKAAAACASVLEEAQGEAADLPARLASIEHLRAALDGRRGRLAGDLLFSIADKLFKMGVAFVEKRDYQSAERTNNEASRPLVEAEAAARHCGCADLLARVEELQESLHLQQCTCASVKAREQGELLLTQAVFGSEVLNREMAFMAADCFKQAVLLTRERDVESEAIALSRLGYVNDKVLAADRQRAQGYYKRAMQLANSLLPRNFTAEVWFTDCSEALQRYQREAVRRDEEARQAEREPYLQELKPVLDELKFKAGQGAHALLKHIYSAHPPTNPAGGVHILEEEPCADNMRRLLRAAIAQLHPDKAAQQGLGLREVVLREEMVKLLNVKYELFK